MEYSQEVVAAARVVIKALGVVAQRDCFADARNDRAGDVLIPADLVAAATAPVVTLLGMKIKEDARLKPGQFLLIPDYPIPELKYKAKPKDLMELWNIEADPKLPACRALTPKRTRQCAARLREFPKVEDWTAFMKCINSSDWMLGNGPANSTHAAWKANFDWFIKPDSIVKFLEGRYEQKDGPTQTARERYGNELDQRGNEERPNG